MNSLIPIGYEDIVHTIMPKWEHYLKKGNIPRDGENGVIYTDFNIMNIKKCIVAECYESDIKNDGLYNNCDMCTYFASELAVRSTIVFKQQFKKFLNHFKSQHKVLIKNKTNLGGEE